MENTPSMLNGGGGGPTTAPPPPLPGPAAPSYFYYPGQPAPPPGAMTAPQQPLPPHLAHGHMRPHYGSPYQPPHPQLPPSVQLGGQSPWHPHALSGGLSSGELRGRSSPLLMNGDLTAPSSAGSGSSSLNFDLSMDHHTRMSPSTGDTPPANATKAKKSSLAGVKSVKFSELQRSRMEDIYSRTPYPPTDEKQRLAEEIGLKYDQVQRWFEGRRKKDRCAKEKNGKTSSTPDPDGAGSPSSSGPPYSPVKLSPDQMQMPPPHQLPPTGAPSAPGANHSGLLQQAPSSGPNLPPPHHLQMPPGTHMSVPGGVVYAPNPYGAYHHPGMHAPVQANAGLYFPTSEPSSAQPHMIPSHYGLPPPSLAPGLPPPASAAPPSSAAAKMDYSVKTEPLAPAAAPSAPTPTKRGPRMPKDPNAPPRQRKSRAKNAPEGTPAPKKQSKNTAPSAAAAQGPNGAAGPNYADFSAPPPPVAGPNVQTAFGAPGPNYWPTGPPRPGTGPPIGPFHPTAGVHFASNAAGAYAGAPPPAYGDVSGGVGTKFAGPIPTAEEQKTYISL